MNNKLYDLEQEYIEFFLERIEDDFQDLHFYRFQSGPIFLC